MKHRVSIRVLITLSTILATVVVLPTVGFCEVPHQISYQGRLVDAEGVPMDGDYVMSYFIYNVPVGGTALWGEGQTIAVDAGIYNVQIGQDPTGNPFPANLFDGPRWLGVTVGADDEMVPRQMLTSTPFAMRASEADDADTLEGISASSFSLTGHEHNAQYVNEDQSNAISSSMIVDGSVNAADLAANSVGGSEIVNGGVASIDVADNSLTAADLAAGSVGTAEVADNSLTAADLASNSVGSTEVIDNSLTAADLGVNSVTSSEIAENAVGTNEISNSSITASDLSGSLYDDFVNINGDTMIGPLSTPSLSVSGNLGVGLTNADKPLYVRQNVTGLTYPLKIENKAYGDATGESDVGILFSAGGDGANGRGKGALVYETTSTWNRGSFHFLQHDGTNSSNPGIVDDSVMTVTNHGRVGIGITSPQSKLHVAGFNAALNVDTSGDSSKIAFQKTGIEKWSIGWSDSADYLFFRNTIAPVGTIMTIKDDTGNVGIGTINTTEKMVVAGNIKIQDIAGSKSIKLRTTGDALDFDFSDKPLYFSNDGTTIVLMHDTRKNVGIGTTDPNADYKLHVRGPFTSHSYAGVFENNSDINSGYVKLAARDVGVTAYGSNIGVKGASSNWDFYADGPGTNYGPFTGAHEVRLALDMPEDSRPGMIVSMTGRAEVRKNADGKISLSSTLPTVSLAQKVNDKAVLGVLVAEVPLHRDHWYKSLEGESFGIVNAIGEGRMWICNFNGPVEVGDYITSSDIPGYGQLQDDDLMHSYTVGKAIETVDWDSVTETIEHDGTLHKVYLIAVIYTSG